MSNPQFETNFYLYFADEASARSAGESVRAEGFKTEVRLGADDENWLCLATGNLTTADADEVEDRLTELAESLGGEFDGIDRGTTPEA